MWWMCFRWPGLNGGTTSGLVAMCRMLSVKYCGVGISLTHRNDILTDTDTAVLSAILSTSRLLLLTFYLLRNATDWLIVHNVTPFTFDLVARQHQQTRSTYIKLTFTVCCYE